MVFLEKREMLVFLVKTAKQAKGVTLVHRVLKETSEDQEIWDRLDL